MKLKVGHRSVQAGGALWLLLSHLVLPLAVAELTEPAEILVTVLKEKLLPQEIRERQLKRLQERQLTDPKANQNTSDVYWSGYRDSILFDDRVTCIRGLTAKDVVAGLKDLNRSEGTQFPTAGITADWFVQLKTDVEWEKNAETRAALQRERDIASGKIKPPPSYSFSAPASTFVLIAANSFAKSDTGEFYTSKRGEPVRVGFHAKRTKQPDKTKSDETVLNRTVSDGKKSIESPPAIIPGYPLGNEFQEIAFTRLSPVRIDLAKPVHTSEDFESVIHLLALTETGRATIRTLMGVEEMPYTCATPIHIHKDPKRGLKGIPESEIEVPSLLQTKMRPGVRVRLVEQSGEGWLIYFKAGEELGLLAMDLLYALAVDGESGLNTLKPGLMNNLPAERGFDYHRKTTREKVAKALAKVPAGSKKIQIINDAMDAKLRWIDDAEKVYYAVRRSSLLNEAHSNGGRFFRELEKELGWELSDLAIDYYGSRERQGAIYAVVKPVTVTQLYASYGGDPALLEKGQVSLPPIRTQKSCAGALVKEGEAEAEVEDFLADALKAETTEGEEASEDDEDIEAPLID